jgi:hypothetical protein
MHACPLRIYVCL